MYRTWMQCWQDMKISNLGFSVLVSVLVAATCPKGVQAGSIKGPTNIVVSPDTLSQINQNGFVRRGHSHNDYHQEDPLGSALRHGMRSIEVDVFCIEDQLLVGHTKFELRKDQTIDNM